ncbi:hypothetical protein [Streptomyces sp. NPDC005828]|uniref:fibronectin type III domain-containing protein n=1 Tax=Streptomyces sp. NPDC005828 TaxID=3157071 RepID=UPI00340124B5
MPKLGGGTYSVTPADAKANYGDIAPEYEQHGIVLKWAANVWIRRVGTQTTGSHAVVTESAKNIQVQESSFDGSWNKGKGGNGYFRGSRVWDSLYACNTSRNLRHFTFQWSASNNVAVGNDFDSDLNLHGGWERRNLFENNKASVSFEHASENCQVNCGEEGGGAPDDSTWWPVWWGAGAKAVKWSGVSGPQNVFYGNDLGKQTTAGGAYQPYYPDRQRLYQVGSSAADASAYQHLAENGSTILDWAGKENIDYSKAPNAGVNASRTDTSGSLFLKSTDSGPGTGDTVPPSAPGGLRSTATTANSVSLAWDPSRDDVGVTGYDVYRNGTLVGSAASTAYIDTGLAASTSYGCAVKARDAAGNASAAGGTLSASTASGPGGTVVDVSTAAQLQSALAGARPGRTVRLAAGEYRGAFVTQRAGTASAPITLTGPPDAVLVNDGPSGTAPSCPTPGGGWDSGYGLWLIAAEHIDIKEGTSNGVIRGNTFDGRGISGQNSADSWVDVKGIDYLIENNTGTFSSPGTFANGYETHNPSTTPSFANGCGNVWRGNTSDLGGVGAHAIKITSTSKCTTDPNVVHVGNTVTNAVSGLTNIPLTP